MDQDTAAPIKTIRWPLLLLFAAAPTGAEERIPIAAGQIPAAIYGSWQSNGYGLIADLSIAGSVLYEYTPTRCWSAQEGGDGMIAYVDHYRLSDDGNELQLYVVGEPHPYQLRRLPKLPKRCTQPLSIAPEQTLAAFLELMAHHYGFFDRYDVDWKARSEAAVAKLPADASDPQLFAVMSDALSGIADAHLSLNAGEQDRALRYHGNRGRTLTAVSAAARSAGQAQGKARRQWQQRIWRQRIGAELLAGQGTLAGNDFLQYGIIGEQIGYLGIFAIGGYASRDFDDPGADLQVLESVLDAALDQFNRAGVKAVILDLSLNQGGFDFIARAIASRFADQPRLAYSKSPVDAQTPYSSDLWIRPTTGKAQWLGPLYVVSSDVTVSAGEILVLSLRAYPQVLHVGATTRGALSDVLGKVLPNGWSLTLSNERYLDHQQRSWEGHGIPPQLSIDPFPPDDLEQGYLAAMAELTALIDKRAAEATH